MSNVNNLIAIALTAPISSKRAIALTDHISSKRAIAVPIHPERPLCANRNAALAPSENGTWLNFCDRYSQNKTPVRKAHQSMVEYFKKTNLAATLPQLLEVADLKNSPKLEQAFQLEQWL